MRCPMCGKEMKQTGVTIRGYIPICYCTNYISDSSRCKSWS